MKRKAKFAACFLLPLALIIASSPFLRAKAANPTATPTTSSILIDGQLYDFDAYNVDGFNYFKLRDLAYVLNGSEKMFSVGWDAEAEVISINRDEEYEPTGGELELNSSPSPKEAFPSTHGIMLDGAKITCEAYTVDGLNYFKLRDIGERIDFLILWNEAANTITVDTTRSYVEEDDASPTASAGPETTLTPTVTPAPSGSAAPEDTDLVTIGGTTYSTGLSKLSFNNVKLVTDDLKQLSKFTKLTELEMLNCQITDISPLEDLTDLNYLYLTGNQISDVTALSGLRYLEQLDLEDNQVKDLAPLAGLTNLNALWLTKNVIDDVKTLAGMKSLTNLWLEGNKITEVSALAELTSLSDLQLSNNLITDISTLSGMKNLVTLNLMNNRLTSVRLTGMDKLEELFLDLNDISELSFFGLDKLQGLSLISNEIKDLSFVSELPGLTAISLGLNDVSDVSPLASLTDLVELDLAKNQVTDVSSLENLSSLKTLYWSSSDLEPLYNLNLSELYIVDLALDSTQKQDFMTAMPNCELKDETYEEIESIANSR
ncbi:MAG: leucine-rich repeat domain-containing protein [Clostridiales bacterium]|nr:leucine-rich repeat domain-containing protein [Clostridiales bacterium]